MEGRRTRLIERVPFTDLHPALASAATLILCAAAIGLRLVAQPVLHDGYPYVSLFPAVILASFLFGTRYGVTAAILCGLAAWYLFIPPWMAFAVDRATFVALAFYTIVVGVDIALVHWMQGANRQLVAERSRNERLAENRELLFRELQHRVSNNLQVVAALLALHRRAVAHDGARRALDEASGRLSLIGKISRALYDPGGQRLGVGTFIGTLVADIVAANGRDDLRIDFAIAEDAALHPDAAIPFSLILAELISNAIEHGFAGRDGGTLHIGLAAAPDAQQLMLVVEDDGHGLPADFRPDGDSLGLRIARTLAQQLNGKFHMEPRMSGGARAVLMLPR